MSDPYIEMSCPNCESQYAVEFVTENVNGEPDHCPFCGEEIPDEDEGYTEEDEDSDDSTW